MLSFTEELLHAKYYVKYWAYYLGFKQPWLKVAFIITNSHKEMLKLFLFWNPGCQALCC